MGVGSDTYTVDILKNSRGALTLSETIKELPGQGTDTLQLRATTNLDFALTPSFILTANIENLDATLVHASIKINLTGNSADNIIIGNTAQNVINGGAGADEMYGGDGDDTYYFNEANDAAFEDLNHGTDLVIISYKNASKVTAITVDMTTPAYDNIENVRISLTGLFDVIGNELDNTITGNASTNHLSGGDGADTLDGGTGADTLDGGDGDDFFTVDSTGDVLIDSDGTDTVNVRYTKGTYILPDFIEYGVLEGRSNINITGNAGLNALFGNDGANIINGGGGIDYMEGGKGNDTYHVDNAGDVIFEDFFQGTDTIISEMNFSLHTRGLNIENLILTGNALNGTGNLLDNIITGNSGDNSIDGRTGVDTLKGGAGNDFYTVDLSLSRGAVKIEDKITESAKEGEDTIILRNDGGFVLTKASKLILASNVENMDASATASLLLNITGNTLNNYLQGNNAGNILTGGTGHDKLLGGGGADTLIGGSGNDRFYYQSGESESGVGHMDIIKDFAAGDKITFDNASGLTYHGLYGTGFADVTTALTAINADGALDDVAVYFNVGTNGYLYVKGDGDGAGTDYDGTLIMAEKKSTAFAEADLEFNTVFAEESVALTNISMDNKAVGSLSSHTDTDAYKFNVAAPGIIQINIDVPTNFYASQPGYKVQILNDSGVEIGEWTLGADGKITVPLTIGGDYTAVISGTTSAKFSADPYSFTLESETSTNANAGDSIAGNISVAGQVDMYETTLLAGHAYSFEALSGGALDPKIKIYDESGRQILVSDDTSHRFMKVSGDEIEGNSVDTHTAFIAPITGTYYISVESAYAPSNPIKDEMVEGSGNTLHYVDYEDTYAATGAYTFNIVEENIDTLIRAQLSGGSYNDQADYGNDITITYAFPTTLPGEFPDAGETGNIYDHGYIQNSFRGFSTIQQAEIREIFDYWESLTGITFTQTDAATAQLKFGWMKNESGGGGSSYRFDTNLDGPNYNMDEDHYTIGKGTVILNSVSSNPQKTDLSSNDFFNLINHELGHALGFEHTDVYTFFGNYAQSNVLPGGYDSLAFSVMTYLGDMGKTINPTSIQLFDIAAAQHLYGANTNYRTGDDNYEFNSTTQEYFTTIWDAGGEDTIDASGQTLASRIYLQAGTASTIGTIGKFDDVSASDLLKAITPGEFGDRSYNNVTIAFNVDIENAKGGQGDDLIIGNALDNKLWGNASSDVLKGDDGEDTLYGGDGHDMLYGGDDADTFVFESGFDESSSDTIADFLDSEDILELSGLLEGFDSNTSDIADFLEFTTSGGDSTLFVDIDGTGTDHESVLLATFKNVTGLDAETLYNNNQILIS